MRNINRRFNLSKFFGNALFKAQVLLLHVRVLHSILHHFISPTTGHFNEFTHLDVCLLDSIITSRLLDVGYIIIQHMLRAPDSKSCSLPYGSITQIPKHFNVPITDPPLDDTMELEEEIITSLCFE